MVAWSSTLVLARHGALRWIVVHRHLFNSPKITSMKARFAHLSLLALGLVACGEPTGTGALPEYRIAVSRSVSDPGTGHSTRDLFLLRADGTGAVNLTNSPGVNEGSPTWSPDGRRIAYIRWNQNSIPYMYELWVMDADGTRPRRVTPSTAGDPTRDPAWSPDGRRIVYVQGLDLHIVGADGSNRTRVATGLHGIASPSWSPDGTRIAFDAGDNSDWSTYTVRPDGSGLTLVGTDTAHEAHPAWSPDGSRIAFTRSTFERAPWTIWTVDPDGRSPVQLTSSADQRSHVTPSWSADGRWMGYVATDGNGGAEGLIVRVDGSEPGSRSIGPLVWGPIAWRP